MIRFQALMFCPAQMGLEEGWKPFTDFMLITSLIVSGSESMGFVLQAVIVSKATIMRSAYLSIAFIF